VREGTGRPLTLVAYIGLSGLVCQLKLFRSNCYIGFGRSSEQLCALPRAVRLPRRSFWSLAAAAAPRAADSRRSAACASAPKQGVLGSVCVSNLQCSRIGFHAQTMTGRLSRFRSLRHCDCLKFLSIETPPTTRPSFIDGSACQPHIRFDEHSPYCPHRPPPNCSTTASIKSSLSISWSAAGPQQHQHCVEYCHGVPSTRCQQAAYAHALLTRL